MVVQVTNMNHTPSRVISQDDLSSASAMPWNTQAPQRKNRSVAKKTAMA